MEQQNPSKISQNNSNYAPVRNMLTPPNPIITKNIDFNNQKANFKIDYTKQTIQSQDHRRRTVKIQDQYQSQIQQNNKKPIVTTGQILDTVSLIEEYSKEKQIFMRYNNEGQNKRGKKQFLASIFISIQIKRLIKLPEYKGMIRDEQLIFDSNFESANLMSVFRTGENTYDLVLQNDVNTSGFTQWFNFKVINKRNNFIAKFSIVNLYKSKSLYNIGMKPIVHSQKSDKNGKKTWRRKGFNIYYQKNDISFEDNPRKYYRSLTFQYDFTTENDVVQFAHAMPYDFNDLQKHLGSIKANPKVTLKQIGVTLLNKPIYLVRIGSIQTTESVEKKAIIVLARQHPGQTPGSFIVEQVINELLRHSIQVDFLIWRFDIYIFPMVNIDGVIMGNYRGNFAGYDLNRCWLKTDPNKQPEVFAIKNYIKKINKKQHVELILDLHGHSRKMGSFFYGNNFGKSPMLFPFIASKANSNILFDDCKFSTQKAAKASTARVVLGNIVKQTGNVYTYEVSFFGNYKNNKVNIFSFNEDHYKELGKALVLSMYRTYMQMYKQEKTLKESVFLKNIKKEIQEFSFTHKEDSQSGSDSEAEQKMNEQRQELDQFFKDICEKQESKKELSKIVEDDVSVIRIKNVSEYGRSPIEKNNEQIKKKISQLLQKNANEDNRENRVNIAHRLPSIYERQQKKQEKQQIRLDKSLQLDGSQQLKVKKNGARLKVYGETFELRARFQSKNDSIIVEQANQLEMIRKKSKKLGAKIRNQSGQYIQQKKQLLKSFNTIAFNDHRHHADLQKQTEIPSEGGKIYKKYKNRNNSLTLKQVTPAFNDQMIHDVVKVNKLDHHRLKEQQNQTKVLVQQMQRNFKLPII